MEKQRWEEEEETGERANVSPRQTSGLLLWASQTDREKNTTEIVTDYIQNDVCNTKWQAAGLGIKTEEKHKIVGGKRCWITLRSHTMQNDLVCHVCLQPEYEIEGHKSHSGKLKKSSFMNLQILHFWQTSTVYCQKPFTFFWIMAEKITFPVSPITAADLCWVLFESSPDTETTESQQGRGFECDSHPPSCHSPAVVPVTLLWIRLQEAG